MQMCIFKIFQSGIIMRRVALSGNGDLHVHHGYARALRCSVERLNWPRLAKHVSLKMLRHARPGKFIVKLHVGSSTGSGIFVRITGTYFVSNKGPTANPTYYNRSLQQNWNVGDVIESKVASSLFSENLSEISDDATFDSMWRHLLSGFQTSVRTEIWDRIFGQKTE